MFIFTCIRTYLHLRVHIHGHTRTHLHARALMCAHIHARTHEQHISIGVHDETEPPYGLVDHAGQLLKQASDSSNVIFATYSMEENRKIRGAESTGFVDALVRFAGEQSAQEAQHRPRTFKYDISEPVQQLELSNLGTKYKSVFRRAMRQIQESKRKSQKKAPLSVEQIAKHENAAFYELFQTLTTEKVFLPSKDLTHLLVFESKSSEVRFRELLHARTPVGNFIMEG